MRQATLPSCCRPYADSGTLIAVIIGRHHDDHDRSTGAKPSCSCCLVLFSAGAVCCNAPDFVHDVHASACGYVCVLSRGITAVGLVQAPRVRAVVKLTAGGSSGRAPFAGQLQAVAAQLQHNLR